MLDIHVIYIKVIFWNIYDRPKRNEHHYQLVIGMQKRKKILLKRNWVEIERRGMDKRFRKGVGRGVGVPKKEAVFGRGNRG